jgi:hypothetical protein
MITQAQWDALPPKGRWDIIVAQRGPDSKASETLKWFTTSVIRHQVGHILRAFGGSALINDDLNAVILTDGRIQGKKGIHGFDWSHFNDHIYQAAKWLELPVVLLGSDAYIDAMEDSTDPHQAITKIIKAWETRYKGEYQGAGYKTAMKELVRHRDEYLIPRYAPHLIPAPKPEPTPDLSGWMAAKKGLANG